ncbi:hypothetical protein HWV62_411 [Athelia sp. TMB]|nr:hypothetical protein HWV62_411 [Athelia sp. TMB]
MAGATGKHVLAEILASPSFSRVGEYGRRVTPLEKITAGKEKLEQKTVDFEKIEEAGLASGNWDVVFITLGTTRAAAGSAEAFEKIDRESKGQTELALADLGYSDTIIFRPGFLAGAERGHSRAVEDAFGYARPFQTVPTALRLTTVIQVLGRTCFSHIKLCPDSTKSIRIAGTFGTSALPSVAEAKKEGSDTPFTVIGNKGALALAKTEV